MKNSKVLSTLTGIGGIALCLLAGGLFPLWLCCDPESPLARWYAGTLLVVTIAEAIALKLYTGEKFTKLFF